MAGVMHGTLTVILLLLLIAAAVGFLAKRLRIHYNVALVLAGVLLAASQALPKIGLQPEIVLQVFLPILLFEATLATDLRRLRENLVPVSVLAVPGVLTTVAVAGLILHAGLGLEWRMACLLGAALAATDTIAVIASFRKVRVPPRLAAIVENESLFNDGTALVAFATILSAIQVGRFDPAQGLGSLAWVTAVGLGCGLLLGYAVGHLMRGTDDHLMEIMLTVIAAYGSALFAETIHVSPVLAVVAAGLVFRAAGWHAVTPTGRVAIRSVWEVAAFGVNSVLFLLIGLQVDFHALPATAVPVAWGLLALTAGRAAAVYPWLALSRLTGHRLPMRWQHLLVWGNLKGGLSMALVLTLPPSLPQRDLLIAIVFGCALVTLTVQGLTLAPVIRWLGVGLREEASLLMEEERGRLLAARAGQAEVDRLQGLGMLHFGLFQRMRASYQGTIARSERRLRDLLAAHSSEETRQARTVRRRLLTVEKSAIQDAATAGILSEEGAAELTSRIDGDIADLGADEEA
jgi:CPA1 family monovalent cation:H+ antiporter